MDTEAAFRKTFLQHGHLHPATSDDYPHSEATTMDRARKLKAMALDLRTKVMASPLDENQRLMVGPDLVDFYLDTLAFAGKFYRFLPSAYRVGLGETPADIPRDTRRYYRGKAEDMMVNARSALGMWASSPSDSSPSRLRAPAGQAEFVRTVIISNLDEVLRNVDIICGSDDD